jgi:hypothetical protein
VATSHASETHLVLHELAETSHGSVPDRETCWIRSGFDKCPRELRMERSNKLRDLLEKHREGRQTELVVSATRPTSYKHAALTSLP